VSATFHAAAHLQNLPHHARSRNRRLI
jgi:hypothetical protein